MAFGIVHMCPQGLNTGDYKGFSVPEVFAARMMREVVCSLFNTFVINMLKLNIWKNITIFEKAMNVKGNGVRAIVIDLRGGFQHALELQQLVLRQNCQCSTSHCFREHHYL